MPAPLPACEGWMKTWNNPFERGEHISYANCGLPIILVELLRIKRIYWSRPRKTWKSGLILMSGQITTVLGIDLDKKQVEIEDRLTGQRYSESFDKLILSPGAEPLRPPISGIDSDKIFSIRNVRDTFRIKDFIDENDCREAIVVGGGFIGLEMAENLHLLGLKVTLVEMADQVMAPLDCKWPILYIRT